MGTISRSKTWVAGDRLNAADLNGELDTAYNVINGNIAAVNLASDAVTTAKILDANVTQAKLGTMEFVIPFSYNSTFSVSAENLRQVMIPYNCTAISATFRTGHDNSAFVVEIGKADINSSSIGSAFCSASVTASGSTVTATGLANSIITANSKIIISAKSYSANCGQPLLVNLYVVV